MPATVNCPTCDKPVPWDADRSPYRPFCCKRCKLIDLGEWFAENHRIGGEPAEDGEDGSRPRDSDFGPPGSVN